MSALQGRREGAEDAYAPGRVDQIICRTAGVVASGRSLKVFRKPLLAEFGAEELEESRDVRRCRRERFWLPRRVMRRWGKCLPRRYFVHRTSERRKKEILIKACRAMRDGDVRESSGFSDILYHLQQGS